MIEWSIFGEVDYVKLDFAFKSLVLYREKEPLVMSTRVWIDPHV